MMLGLDWPRLHAMVNDLPVGLLLAAVFFDLVGAVTRRPGFRQVGFWTLTVGTLGAAAAVLSGREAEHDIAHGDAVHQVMERHELLGFITLGTFAVLLVWRLLRDSRMGAAERGAMSVLSFAGAVVLFVTGMYGGRLVFEHAAGISTEVLTAEAANRASEHSHAGGPGVAGDSVAPHVDPPGTPPHSHPPDTQPNTH